MIEFSDNPVFFMAIIIGTISFAIAVLWTSHSFEKDRKKKPHKSKKI